MRTYHFSLQLCCLTQSSKKKMFFFSTISSSSQKKNNYGTYYCALRKSQHPNHAKTFGSLNASTSLVFMAKTVLVLRVANASFTFALSGQRDIIDRPERPGAINAHKLTMFTNIPQHKFLADRFTAVRVYLHMKPSFPPDYISTPRVRPDSLSLRATISGDHIK